MIPPDNNTEYVYNFIVVHTVQLLTEEKRTPFVIKHILDNKIR